MTFRRILTLLAALALAACDSLPASGPTRNEIQTAVNPDLPGEIEAGFTIVEMSDEVSAKLEAWPKDTFADAFPDSGTGASFRITTGDVVAVTLWESLASGLSGGLFLPGGSTQASGAAPIAIPPQVVGNDGHITVPFAGRVRVSGRTVRQIESAIVAALEGKAINPQAIVTAQKSASNLVSVIGDATTGGAVSLRPGADRLTEVISATGGVTKPIDRTRITLARGDVVASQPLQRILEDPSQNLRLSPGDVVTVSEALNKFTAIGATGINARRDFGYQPFFLSDALGEVGGVLDSRGDPSGVYVMRLEEPALAKTAFDAKSDLSGSTPVAFHFDFDKPDTFFFARRFEMRDRDIVFIANAPTVEIQKLLDIFRSAASTVQVVDRTNAF